MAITASRAAVHGPSGFSLELMTTASLGKARESAKGPWARASTGSETMRNPTAAAAAADDCKKDLRERFIPLSRVPMIAPPEHNPSVSPVNKLPRSSAECSLKLCREQSARDGHR